MAWWPIGLYRVDGQSMLPTYGHYDLLIGWRWFTPGPGQVVVADHDLMIIKRITKADSKGYWLEGDNSDLSTDSRTFGYVTRSQLRARVILRVAKG